MPLYTYACSVQICTAIAPKRNDMRHFIWRITGSALGVGAAGRTCQAAQIGYAPIAETVTRIQGAITVHKRADAGPKGIASPMTAMGISTNDVVPLSQARANFSELAEEVKAGAEKIITKNGESYVALIDAQRLDHYDRRQRERIHLLLIDQGGRGLDDVAAGRVKDDRGAIQSIKRRRSA